jgi:hypothetical protein
VEKIKTLWAEKKALVIGVGVAIVVVIGVVISKVRKGSKTSKKGF